MQFAGPLKAVRQAVYLTNRLFMPFSRAAAGQESSTAPVSRLLGNASHDSPSAFPLPHSSVTDFMFLNHRSGSQGSGSQGSAIVIPSPTSPHVGCFAINPTCFQRVKSPTVVQSIVRLSLSYMPLQNSVNCDTHFQEASRLLCEA